MGVPEDLTNDQFLDLEEEFIAKAEGRDKETARKEDEIEISRKYTVKRHLHTRMVFNFFSFLSTDTTLKGLH